MCNKQCAFFANCSVTIKIGKVKYIFKVPNTAALNVGRAV
ncbi:hypothetical protein SAMN05428978_101415 [Nitrosomonas sp. Nm34]|nr:hypothetical protein SAMN05428978_101415 [Nitrosomonas sp. Nm34]